MQLPNKKDSIFVCFLLLSLFFSVNVFAPPLTIGPNVTSNITDKNLLDVKSKVDDLTNQKSQESQTIQQFFEEASYEELSQQDDTQMLAKNNTGKTTVKEESVDSVDPTMVSLVQSVFLEKIKAAFTTVASYALTLLYYFATLEIVVFGLVWAIQGDVGFGKLFFKIIKIGLIIFIIKKYAWILDSIISSFSQIADIVVSDDVATKNVLNPAKIWQYGYDVGIQLLKSAVNATGFGMAMVQIVLGMGVLFVFGLFGVQIAVQMVCFYVVALGGLILLPFGVFSISSGMFDRAVQSILQAGIRLMVLIIIVGIAVVVWDGFNLIELSSKFNINQVLGLFFSGLLFLCFITYLPGVLSQIVGNLSGSFFEGGTVSGVTQGTPSISMSVSSGGVGSDINVASTVAASNISAGSVGSSGGGGGGSAATSPSVVIAPASGGIGAKTSKESLDQASNISKSISENTVQKLKDVILQAVKDKK